MGVQQERRDGVHTGRQPMAYYNTRSLFTDFARANAITIFDTMFMYTKLSICNHVDKFYNLMECFMGWCCIVHEIALLNIISDRKNV